MSSAMVSPASSSRASGNDEGTAVTGRGWATVSDDGLLTGHIFIHDGDDSSFRAVREGADAEA